MANISFKGIGVRSVTMLAGAGLSFDKTVPHGTAHAGKAVKISASGTVVLVATGDNVWGKLIQLEPDGFCTVQVEGFAELPTDGTAIVYGGGVVGGATAGTVKAGASTRNIAIQSAANNAVMVQIN